MTVSTASIPEAPRSRRAQLARDLQDLRTRAWEALGPLAADLQDAETGLQNAYAALSSAKLRRDAARDAFAGATADWDQQKAPLVAELQATASPAFAAFRDELAAGWETARARGGQYMGVGWSDVTREGQTLLSQRFIAAFDRVSALELDGEIGDAQQSVSRERSALVHDVWTIAREHTTERARPRIEGTSDATVRAQVLDADVQFRAQQGWPAYALEAYRAEQLAALSLST